MKQFRKGILSIVCTLALLYTLVIPARAADPMFYDCVLYLFGFNDVPEVVTQSVAIQVQAADVSGGVWAVASVQVTQGATQYIAADPSDSGSNAYAELIAADPDSGIAVFHLDGQITSRSAPTLQTLDGLSAGDSVAVAGISQENDSLYYFSRGAYLQSLQSQSGYSFLALQDGSSPLSELVIYPIGAVMTDTDTVPGSYLGRYIALPAGYIMPEVDGIGTLGSGDTGTDDGGEAEPPPETGDFTPDTILSDTGIDDLLQQAEAERRRKIAEENPEAAALEEMRATGEEYIRKIRSLNDALPAQDISEKLDRLESICSQIFSYVGEHSEKLPQIRRFMSYYLPTTLKLTESYRDLEQRQISTDEVQSVKQEILETLDNINLAFQNLYKNLMQKDLMGLSADISALETMLTQEGLMDSELKMDTPENGRSFDL